MTSLPGVIVHKQLFQGLDIEIHDEGDLRTLYFSGQYLQSSMSLADPVRLTLSYTQIMAFSVLLSGELRRILMIGVGGGSLVRFFHHFFPDCHIEGVDNSARVLDLARGWFGLPENDRVTIHCQNGASYLANNAGHEYDLILIDAYDGRGMAQPVYSPEFLTLASKALAPGGLVTANTWSGDQPYFDEVQQSFGEIFSGYLMLPVPERGNVVITAANSAIPWDRINKRSNQELSELSRHYGINWPFIIKLAKQKNLSLTDRIKSFFS